MNRQSSLALFEPMPKAPAFVLIGSLTPPKSRAEMDAAARLPGVRSEVVPGPLTAHEECPREVAAAIDRMIAAPS